MGKIGSKGQRWLKCQPADDESLGELTACLDYLRPLRFNLEAVEEDRETVAEGRAIMYVQ